MHETNKQTIELIPLIEIGYNSQDIPSPEKGPFGEYPKEWDDYHAACYAKAGFADIIPMYLPGFWFCMLKDITDANLTKLVKDHTEKMRSAEYDRDQACAFSGGYLLRVDGEDKYFPQCCGDLADIQYWTKLVNEGEDSFYQGHPAPRVDATGDTIILDFTPNEYDEDFVPPVKDTKLGLDRSSLAEALTTAKIELELFAERLAAINVKEQLGISKIDNLLIWGDNY